MAKPKTLRERAREANPDPYPSEFGTNMWIKGYRAGSRPTKAERAVIEAATAYTLYISLIGTGVTPEQRIYDVGRRRRLRDDMQAAVEVLQSKKVRK